MSDNLNSILDGLETSTNNIKVNIWGSQADRKLWIRYKIWNNLPPYLRPFIYFFYRYIRVSISC